MILPLFLIFFPVKPKFFMTWVRDCRHYFSSQDAFLLLKNSFYIPKVLHLLRSAPTFLSVGLVAYDKAPWSPGIYQVANVRLDNRAWSHVSLPVKDGGLGVRSAVDLATSAYLSSTCTGSVCLAGPAGFRLQETVWSQPQYLGE